MGKIVKIMLIFIVVMIIFLFLPDMNNEYVGEKKEEGKEALLLHAKEKGNGMNPIKEADRWVNDSIYVWDEEQVNWIATEIYEDNQYQGNINDDLLNKKFPKEPIEVKWEILMNIQYRLRYFTQIQADVFSPVFDEEIKALNGKEVIIEGFVIPFDEEGELLALSYNPYSSCFFCGNASPASVISMYMEDKDALYNLDDFKKFKGTLFLNSDDPDQFYYILKDVVAL